MKMARTARAASPTPGSCWRPPKPMGSTCTPVSWSGNAGETSRPVAAPGAGPTSSTPVTNTQGESALPLVRALAKAGVQQNVTALMTLAQVRDVAAALGSGPPACVSVFAGRVADTGRDPVPLMAAAVQLLAMYPQLEL